MLARLLPSNACSSFCNDRASSDSLSSSLVAPPPAPVRIPEVEPERTESERIESERIESERIRRGRVKSVEARHQKGDNRDVAYMNPMKKLREKRKNKDKGNPTIHF